MERAFNLLPPPRLALHGEPAAIIEPQLRELQPFRPVDQLDEWEPFTSEVVQPKVTPELTRHAQSVALNDERVQRLLSDKRYVAIGASLRDAGDEVKGEHESLVYVFYEYSGNVVVEVTLDAKGRRVENVETTYYQPAPARKEIEEAVMLARHDSRLADRLSDDMEGFAIVVTSMDDESAIYRHRLFDVRFLCPGDRLPRCLALVDLSTQRVLRAGTGCSGELQD